MGALRSVVKPELPTTHYGLRIVFRVALLVCILATSLAGVSACRSNGIRIGSWDEAIDYAAAELEASHDLAARLDEYELMAAKMSAKIELLDEARPALELIADLREVQVPLIGNGWQILLGLMGLVSVDGARIIAALEDVLRSLAELKHSLDYLSGLSAVAGEVRDFRAEPTRRTLLALSSTSASATPSMRRLHEELGEKLEPLDYVTNGFSGLVNGLRNAANAEVPVVSGAAHEAAERLGHIEEPLLTLRDDLRWLYQGIEADTQVLENIQEAVRQAKKHNE